MVIVINADDFGLSDGICKAILELFDAKAISNTTIMMAVPEIEKRLLRWNVSSLCGKAGIHLQLSDGKPLSPISEITSLVNPATGNFLPRNVLKNVNPMEVEREWLRQIEMGSNLLGGYPTHIDSHKGVHRIPECSEVYLSIAARLKIPVRGGTDHIFKEKMKAAKVSGSTLIVREWTGIFLGITDLIQALKTAERECKDDDIIEVVSHPGYSDDYLKSISSLNSARENDRLVLDSLAKKEVLNKNGFQLVSYPKLSA